MSGPVLLGIDVGGTNIKMMAADGARRVLAKRSMKTRSELGYERVSDKIIGTLEDMLREAGIDRADVSAVGMGLPGIVDAEGSTSVHLAYVGWDGFDPCAKIAGHFGVPHAIDNDANLSALGEYVFSADESLSSLVLLTLGTGLGGGVVIDGRIFGGSKNLACEFGHMTLTPDEGETCLCGRKGCWEAYCSGSAMAVHAKRLMADHPDTVLHRLVGENGGEYDNRLVGEGARANDPVCVEILRRYNRYLAIGCANVMKLFNPQVILLGGGLSGLGDLIFGPVNRDVVPRLLHERQHCPIERARLGPEAGMYGAVALAERALAGGTTDPSVSSCGCRNRCRRPRG